MTTFSFQITNNKNYNVSKQLQTIIYNLIEVHFDDNNNNNNKWKISELSQNA